MMDNSLGGHKMYRKKNHLIFFINLRIEYVLFS